MVVSKVRSIVARLIDSYAVVVLDCQVLLMVLVAVAVSQATSPSIVSCPIGVMVGDHPTPGAVTDRPEVWVEGGHAGGET